MTHQKDSKIFVLDTSVVMHDPEAIYSFGDNDVYISPYLIEEIDTNKKDSDPSTRLQAREFSRVFKELTNSLSVFEKGKGIRLEQGGTVYMQMDEPGVSGRKNANTKFNSRKNDHEFINLCIYLQNKEDKKSSGERKKVFLVSRDDNQIAKAKMCGVYAEEYKKDKVDVEELRDDIRELSIKDFSPHKLFNEKEKVLFSDLGEYQPTVNEFIFLKNGEKNKKHLLMANRKGFYELVDINREVCKIKAMEDNFEQACALHALLDPEIKLVALRGPSGSGKTLLAIASAIAQKKHYIKIMVSRPIVALSDKDMGYLPGDSVEKVRPFMQPIYDNINFIVEQNDGKEKGEGKKINDLTMGENPKIIIEPLAYIRGRSIRDTFFIVDEAQNLTPHEVKTIVSRAGEGTKIVFTGDIKQIDIGGKKKLDASSNGLSFLIDRLTGKGEGIFAGINLVKGERSELANIANKYL